MASAMKTRSSDDDIYLVGKSISQISGRKLPSKRQVSAFLYYNMREHKYSVKQSALIVIDEVFTFWARARIPTRQRNKCAEKVEHLYDELRSLWKSKN